LVVGVGWLLVVVYVWLWLWLLVAVGFWHVVGMVHARFACPHAQIIFVTFLWCVQQIVPTCLNNVFACV